MCDRLGAIISLDGESGVDYLLDQWLKLEIMVDLAGFLLVFVLPKDSNVDAECSPPYPCQLHNPIIGNRIGNE